jgi:hypothetical protein
MRPASSRGEKAVFDALRTALPPGWSAWHSLRLRDGAAWLGEGDFVLAHPVRGVLVLEVKSGRISQRDGRWYTYDEPLKRPPLEQGLDFASLLRRRLAKHGCQPPAMGAAVVFPETEFDQPPGEDMLAGVVLGRLQLAWLREALPPLVERAVPPTADACGPWIERIHDLWSESWVPGLALGTRVKELGRDRYALTDGQLGALDVLLENDRVLVRGGAGSGKTLIAAEAARREAASCRRVLFLCFTQPLRKWLAARLESAGVEVKTVSGLAKAAVDAVHGRTAPDVITDSEFWESTLYAACDLIQPRWDTVIVDEAQDLQESAWMLVSQLAPRGRRLWAFTDPAQSFWADRHPPTELFETRLPLRSGLRCPRGIQELANRYVGAGSDDTVLRAALADDTLGVVVCPSATSVPEKIGAEVDRLLAKGMREGDIAIVSLRGQTARDAIFTRDRVAGHALARADAAEMADRLVADSFLRWKGLERPAVIVTDLPDRDLPQRNVRMHVALTRALIAARVIAPRANIERDPILSGLLTASR